jgi:hypothetical protein
MRNLKVDGEMRDDGIRKQDYRSDAVNFMEKGKARTRLRMLESNERPLYEYDLPHALNT